MELTQNMALALSVTFFGVIGGAYALFDQPQVVEEVVEACRPLPGLERPVRVSYTSRDTVHYYYYGSNIDPWGRPDKTGTDIPREDFCHYSVLTDEPTLEEKEE